MNRKTLIATAVTAALAVPAYAQANDLNFDFYGSARVQVESVHPDNEDVLDSYTGVRDAYSRIGFNADYQFTEGLTLVGQFELPFDIANKEVQDTWDQDEDIRVAQIGVQGDLGTLLYGQMWMPYYNAVAYPVDMFSTYYSGFATQTSFRLQDSIAYYSPDMNGLTFGFSWSEDGGQPNSSGNAENRVQLTGTYTIGDTSFSLGMDDRRGQYNERSVGASVAHTMGNLYLAAKYEHYSNDGDFDADPAQGFYGDGATAINVYAGYTLGKNTFKIMLADVEDYGENVVHLGYDYQMTDALKLFGEYYYEEGTAAITEERGGFNETAWDASGGQVFAAGMRYDF